MNTIEKILNTTGTNSPHIVIINMVNGYEIIGEVHESANGFYHLEKALLFASHRGEGGKPTIGLVPPVNFAEESRTGYKVSIAQTSIATIYEPSEQILQYYKEETSPIILASSL